MAPKRSSRASQPRGKSRREAQVERVTWAALVLVFALTQLAPAAFPPLSIPLSGAVILLGSGVYQSVRGWRVSLVTWLAGIAMAAFAFYNLTVDASADFLGEALIAFALVILWGVVRGET
ncbi:hypothetical protein FBR02_04345 [Anaerolineae bacterium CFX9]|nr:hypothetical protein [Anaerolineae bacterium CFX9]